MYILNFVKKRLKPNIFYFSVYRRLCKTLVNRQVFSKITPFFLLFLTQTIFANSFIQSDLDSLFVNEMPLEITLIYKVQEVLKDRGEKPKYHAAQLIYLENGVQKKLQVKVQTRGIMRKKSQTCSSPPLRIKFPKSERKNTIFEASKKLKMVVQCRNSKDFNDYLITEYLIYKIYNLLSNYSFRVRLLKVKFIDKAGKHNEKNQYAFFIESNKNTAKRLQGKFIKVRNIKPDMTDYERINTMSIFQYMLGNTDWSVKALHNIKLLFFKNQKAPVAIPYDFDFAGLVDARYAKPAPELHISTVRTRVFNGYKRTEEEQKKAAKLFIQKKEKIYELFTNCNYLSDKKRKNCVAYLDSFYKIIKNKKKRKREFINNCRTE